MIFTVDSDGNYTSGLYRIEHQVYGFGIVGWTCWDGEVEGPTFTGRLGLDQAQSWCRSKAERHENGDGV